jgi:hypothetical protein
MKASARFWARSADFTSKTVWGARDWLALGWPIAGTLHP